MIRRQTSNAHNQLPRIAIKTVIHLTSTDLAFSTSKFILIRNFVAVKMSQVKSLVSNSAALHYHNIGRAW